MLRPQIIGYYFCLYFQAEKPEKLLLAWYLKYERNCELAGVVVNEVCNKSFLCTLYTVFYHFTFHFILHFTLYYYVGSAITNS